MPAATTDRFSAWPRATMAETMTTSSSLSSRVSTKARSILISLAGSRLRCSRLDTPVPKLSMAMPTPSAATLRSTAIVVSVSRIIALSLTSSVRHFGSSSLRPSALRTSSNNCCEPN
ncbi:hypothetical protein D3C81_1846020 [compost metagenome]